jgi:hypothetical protein
MRTHQQRSRGTLGARSLRLDVRGSSPASGGHCAPVGNNGRAHPGGVAAGLVQLVMPAVERSARSRDGLSKVMSILKTAAVAAGVRLDDSGVEPLTHVEKGVCPLLSKGKRPIDGQIASALGSVVLTLPPRRRPR